MIGEARVYYGFARPIGCIVTIGTGMNPNIALPKESTNTFGNLFASAGVAKSMFNLVTLSEHAAQIAAKISEPGTYFRFNVGSKIAERRWVERVVPSLYDKWVKGAKEHDVEHYEPEDWLKITIELDDWAGMKTFVELTLKYLNEGEQLANLDAVGKKLKITTVRK